MELEEKQKFYNEPKIRELMKKVVLSGSRIEPQVSNSGKILYNVVSETVGEDIDQKALLESLVSAGILIKKEIRKLVACPVHGRVDVLPLLTCPKCGKHNMSKTMLLSHILCGYNGEKEAYESGSRLVCPRCKREIKDQRELKLSGIWFECNECGARVSTPNFTLLCREGEHEFKVPDLVQETLYAYEVPENVKNELKVKEVLGPSLKELLASYGFNVTSPAALTGKSGATHHVDVYALLGDVGLTIEVAIDSKPIDTIPVITYFAKVYDISVKYPIMVAIPAATDQAMQLANGYGIKMILDDGSNVTEKVREHLAQLGLVKK